jgi:hypothetical protein
MNLFTGMTPNEIWSVALMFALFNGYAGLSIIALFAFRISSRPRNGLVRVGALWHIAAIAMFMMALVATVWAAPAEKSFVGAKNNLFPFGDVWTRGWSSIVTVDLSQHFAMAILSMLFAGAGVFCMLLGFVVTGSQKRRAAREALLAA